MIMEKIAKRSEVSNAWNFDFDDDDESDRADVAAFEYADSPTRGQDSALVSQAHAENFGEHEYDFNKFRTIRSADFDSNRPGVGFDDFDDEDDVGSYEIDTPNNYSVRKATSNDFSEAEGFFETEDIESSDNNFRELPAHPNWKSSHVAESRHRSRGRGPTAPSRGLSFGSDEEFGPHSNLDDDLDEDFKTGRSKGNKTVSDRNSRRRAGEDTSFSDSESDNEDLHTLRKKFKQNKTDSNRRGNNFKGSDSYSFVNDTQFRTNGKMDNRRNYDGNRSSRGK
ncbi:hypothetical protein JRO89_XS03G0316400 [Xanthoceras sorbifolium]|uniref:Uncharacterized protein n=1 Tax=Xanthoceras sorbifolium TaxID=99658 RepID=A0ABQ8ID53_9ROSI|nr:hypothetical protein JRO89_XS03G0316400 [Xanthoceras sorbifolium]